MADFFKTPMNFMIGKVRDLFISLIDYQLLKEELSGRSSARVTASPG